VWPIRLASELLPVSDTHGLLRSSMATPGRADGHQFPD